jgi:tetratricopeptide (TPR) repeat protein
VSNRSKSFFSNTIKTRNLNGANGFCNFFDFDNSVLFWRTNILNAAIKLDSGGRRFLPAGLAILATLGAIWAFFQFFGDSLAANALDAEIAANAVSIVPSNPLAHAALATLKTENFVAEDLPVAKEQFEMAAALSPNDYRYWFALARMRERLGDAAGAETAARRSLELAPNFAQTLWLHGNILLRNGNASEALIEMRRAVETDSQYAPTFLAAVAQTLNTDDVNVLRRYVGESASLRAALATFLAEDKKFDEAAAVWRELPEADKTKIAKDLATAFLKEKKYRAAVPLVAFAAAREADRPEIGKILNGGFEDEIVVGNAANPFVWQIADGAQPQIAPFASAAHTGERSLIIVYNSSSGADFRSVAQTVAVESNADYHLEVWAKTANVKTSATVHWEIADAASGAILAKTASVATGDSDWQMLVADFSVPINTEAIIVRLARTACAQPPCAITGKIWFDDVRLLKKPSM